MKFFILNLFLILTCLVNTLNYKIKNKVKVNDLIGDIQNELNFSKDLFHFYHINNKLQDNIDKKIEDNGIKFAEDFSSLLETNPDFFLKKENNKEMENMYLNLNNLQRFKQEEQVKNIILLF